jgi:hypothetical protein
MDVNRRAKFGPLLAAHACSGPYQSGHLDLSMIP